MDAAAGRNDRFVDFVDKLPFSRSKVYAYPPELQPRSEWIGNSRIVTESVDEYLQRLAVAHRDRPRVTRSLDALIDE